MVQPAMQLQGIKMLQDDDGCQGLLHEQHNSSAPVAVQQAEKDATGYSVHGSALLSLVQAPRRLWNSGLTCAFLASLIFSFSALCVKLTGGRIPVLEVCFIRSSISFGLTIVLMKSTGMSPIFGQRKNLRLLFMRGCCGACSMTSYYVGLFLLPLGDAVTIGLIGPAVTATAARIFLKEPLGYRGGAGCLVSMAGVIVLSRPPFLFGGEDWQRNQALGVAATVLSAFLGAGSSMTIRLIGSKEQAAVIAMWFHTCTMIMSSIPLALGIPAKFSLLAGKDFGLMLGVACTSFVAQLLSTRGLQMVVAAKAAAMGFTQVFYSYIMGAIFFNEHISSGGMLGVLMILAGVLMVTLRSNGRASAEKAATAPRSGQSTVIEPLQQDTKAACGDVKSADAEQAQLLSLAGEALDVSNTEAAVDAAVLIRAKVLRATVDDEDAIDASRSGPLGGLSAFLQGQVLTAETGDVERQLALVAAQAAAALGGELCPATTASVAATRQASLEAELFYELRASRRGSARVPAAVHDLAATLSAASASSAAATVVAAHAVDIPNSGVQQGLSRQVSGWLAANLLATSPAGFVRQSSSLKRSAAAVRCDSFEGDAGNPVDRQTTSRQASGWWPTGLSETQPAAAEQLPASPGLTEALLGSATMLSPAGQQDRELSLAGQGFDVSSAGSSSGTAEDVGNSDSHEQRVRAASHLGRVSSTD